MSNQPEWVQILVVLLISAAIMVPMGVVLILVIRDTWRGAGRWGMNFRPLQCPVCGDPSTEVRLPANFQQMVWGGYTCSECGCEYDKWGKPVKLPEDVDAEPFGPRTDAVRKPSKPNKPDIQRGPSEDVRR